MNVELKQVVDISALVLIDESNSASALIRSDVNDVGILQFALAGFDIGNLIVLDHHVHAVSSAESAGVLVVRMRVHFWEVDGALTFSCFAGTGPVSTLIEVIVSRGVGNETDNGQ